ncbi:MAG: hypothetical protein LBN95_08255 [Prevotellaceae bacterium]|jgi:hypothetical protein|nr:hypothetical protein [Prevotellaceae bacterium]
MTEVVSAKGYVIARYSEAIQIYYKNAFFYTYLTISYLIFAIFTINANQGLHSYGMMSYLHRNPLGLHRSVEKI